MTLNDYQTVAMQTAVFPTHGDMPIIYPALGLAGETGEVVDKIKKVVRQGEFTVESNDAIARELGDVLWYIAVLADGLGFALADIAAMNLHKLSDRQSRGVLKSEGDNR